MKFGIKNRFSGKVQLRAEIKCDKDASTSIKIGLATQWAIKTDADLRGADLFEANLSCANLLGANLKGTCLINANLTNANLRYACLRNANLRGSNLTDADLRDASLKGADLTNANLKVKNPALRDHYFISEILLREAKGDYRKRAFAGFIRINSALCWNNVYGWGIPKTMIEWSKKVLCEKWPEFERMFYLQDFETCWR